MFRSLWNTNWTQQPVNSCNFLSPTPGGTGSYGRWKTGFKQNFGKLFVKKLAIYRLQHSPLWFRHYIITAIVMDFTWFSGRAGQYGNFSVRYIV